MVERMSAHRHEGRVGAQPTVVEASDTAYGDHTFTVPSKAGITLPSERFCPAGCITRGEWERRHTGTYGPTTQSTNKSAPAADATGSGAHDPQEMTP